MEEVETAKDSRLAREFVVALPIELNREQHPARPRIVPFDTGKELFVGELLVIVQAKFTKKALSIRAHDS